MVTAEDPLMDYRLFNDSLQRDAGWVSTKDSDGTDVLREVKDDS
eukprot:COSAG06_NODE_1229_length_10175_cov_11.379516_1_plen_43_part_10